MKNTILILSFIAILSLMSSCGNPSEEVKLESTTVEQATESSKTSMDLSEGKAIYEQKCQVCHQANGEGIIGAFPPLAKSDYLKDKIATIKAPTTGLQGELVVNGITYNSVMVPVPMSDEEHLAVMNYIYNSWGNEGIVTMEDILASKK